MKKLLDLITEEVVRAFEACDYKGEYGKVTLLIGRISVNISVMGVWLQLRNITVHPFRLRTRLWRSLGKVLCLRKPWRSGLDLLI